MLHATRSPFGRTRLTLELLEERIALATRTWSGGGANTNWSTAANWGVTGVPSSGDDLQFPATNFLTSTNDIVDLTLNSISFTTGTGYTLAGVGIFLGGSGSLNSNAAGTNQINLDLGLFASIPIVSVAAGGTLALNGVLSGSANIQKTNPGELVLAGNNTFTGGVSLSAGTLTVGSNTAVGTGTLVFGGGTTLRADTAARTLSNAFTFNSATPITFGGTSALTLSGSGGFAASSITLNVTNTALTTLSGDLRLAFTSSALIKTGAGTLALGGTNTYGNTTVNAGTLLVNGVQSGFGVTFGAGSTLGGNGVLGALVSTGGTLSPGVSPGRLSTSSVQLSAATTVFVELNGTAPGTGHDLVDANGAINLAGSTLTASLGFVPALNDTFSILRTLGALTGMFNGLPNGALLTIGARPFRINYSANDVTLTRVQGTTTVALAASSAATVFGQSVTFTATVTGLPSGAAAPTGTVTFRDGGTAIGTGVLNAAGQATFATTGLSVGAHNLDAVYGGDPDYTGSTSPPVTVTVGRASTTTVLTAAPNPVGLSVPLTLTATVAAVAPGAGAPSGTVTFRDGGTALGTGTLNAAGQATFTTSTLTAGQHSLDAVYAGDNNFAASTAPPVVVTVGKANTTTVLVTSANPVGVNVPLIISAIVSPIAPAVGTPTGTVTFVAFPEGQLQNQTTLGTVALSGGRATLTVANLPAGCHVLIASYAGDTNFNASTSVAFRQAIGLTPNQAFVLALYRDVLERAADVGGFNFWVSRLDTGSSRTLVASAFWLSAEHRGIQVDTLYRNLLRRNADAPGRAFWVNALLAGTNEVEAAATFAGSAEYAATHRTNAEYVNGLYTDLLGRAADSAGATYWTQILQAGARDRAAVAYYFLTTREAYLHALDDFFRVFLGRAPDAAGRTGLLNVLETGSSPVSLAAVILGSTEYFNRVQIAAC